MQRKYLLAANWKMNQFIAEIQIYFDQLQKTLGHTSSEIFKNIDVLFFFCSLTLSFQQAQKLCLLFL